MADVIKIFNYNIRDFLKTFKDAKQDYNSIARDLYEKGFDEEEIYKILTVFDIDDEDMFVVQPTNLMMKFIAYNLSINSDMDSPRDILEAIYQQGLDIDMPTAEVIFEQRKRLNI